MYDSDDNNTQAESGKGKPLELSNAESRFFCNIVKHLSNKADIDWKKVAEATGFKNAGVAKTRFGQIKRKLGLTNPTKSAADGPPRTPKRQPKTEPDGVSKSTGKGSAKKKHEVKTEEGTAAAVRGTAKVKKEEDRDEMDEMDDEDGNAAIAQQLAADTAQTAVAHNSGMAQGPGMDIDGSQYARAAFPGFPEAF